MEQGVLRVYDLNPDGVRVVINWDALVVGASMFIPCINTNQATQQLTTITDKKGWKTTTKVTVESGKLGVRMWRTM
jgi:hypothetical protein